jgi:hypothetical protein
MIFILLRTLVSALRSHRALALENLALRHQLEADLTLDKGQAIAAREMACSRPDLMWSGQPLGSATQ